MLAGAPAHFRARWRVGQPVIQRANPRVRIVRGHEHSRFAIADRVAHPFQARCEQRASGGGGLERDDAESFDVAGDRNIGHHADRCA